MITSYDILAKPTAGPHRVILQESKVGFYILVFDSMDSQAPEKDYLQDTLYIAMEVCMEDYGINRDSWQQIEDVDLV